MASARLPTVLSLAILACASVLFLPHFVQRTVYSAASHIVISEIQVGGVTANDEFVELYNPTADPVDLTGWRLRKTGGSSVNLVASMSGIIPSHGFFLVAHPSYTGSVVADLGYSATSSAITGNSTITLFSDAGTTTVDKVGIGSVADFEGAAVASPSAAGSSIERKANASSTVASMGSGGADELAGNGEDSNNNTNDFIQRAISQPQNSQSAREPSTASTPTETPAITETISSTLTPSPTPPTDISETPSPSLSPTQTPSVTVSPTTTTTLTPAPSVTVTPIASPTMTPSPVPVTPSPTLTPTRTSTPTVLPPSPTLTTSPIIHPLSVVCSVTYHTVQTRWLTITLPHIHCSVQRS